MYKIGQKVRLKSVSDILDCCGTDRCIGNGDGRLYYNSLMEYFGNTTIKITGTSRIGSCIYPTCMGWTWHPDWIVPVNNTKFLTNFK